MGGEGQSATFDIIQSLYQEGLINARYCYSFGVIKGFLDYSSTKCNPLQMIGALRLFTIYQFVMIIIV